VSDDADAVTQPAEQVVCATCGTVAEDASLATLTWARGTENGRQVWTCDRCSRQHLRSIEGKLDSAWW
jgi:hypothetical protein